MINKLGKLNGINIYQDEYHPTGTMTIGRKSDSVNFIIGVSTDLDTYKSILRKIFKDYDREIKLDDLLNNLKGGSENITESVQYDIFDQCSSTSTYFL